MPFYKQTKGNIVLEAALIMPFFSLFIIALVCMMKISMTETALQSAVSETTKVLATHMYPVQIIVGEVHEQWHGSEPGRSTTEIINNIKQAMAKVQQFSDFIDDYKALLPDFMLPMVEFILQMEENLGSGIEDMTQHVEESLWNPLLQKTFKPLVLIHADRNKLQADRLHITRVVVPDLIHGEQLLIGIEAEYVVKLPLPFYRKEIRLVKQSYERVWVGSQMH